MSSIRRQLSLNLLMGSAMVLLVASLVIGIVMRGRVMLEFDRTLQAKANAFAMVTELDGRRLEIDFSAAHMPEFGEDEDEDEDAAYFQLFLHDGTTIAKSESLDVDELPFDDRVAAKPHFHNIRLPDDRRGRLVQLAYQPRVETEDEPAALEEVIPEDDEIHYLLPATMAAGPLTIHVVLASGREDLDALLLSLYLTLALADIVLLLGIAAVVKRSIRTSLEPVNAMNQQLAKMSPDALDRRIQLASTPDELMAIKGTLNSLLDRLQAAFEKERNFISNVAHELRTPVAELMASSDVGAKWPEDTEQTRQFFEDVRAVAMQMDHTVSNLLELSRCDIGSTTITRDRIAVAEMVDACWARVPAAIRADNLTMDNRLDPGLNLETDRAKLQMILQNIVDNAAAYSVPGTVVICTGQHESGGFALAIENQAPGLTDSDISSFFDRFWRKDASRTGSQHSGLGLPLAKALAELLGIRMLATLKDGHTIRLELTFPVAM
ncbi:MAG: ATP-binding protein [Verrucomicrobia bacterium]|nr:ATP-binding protein [Verrucomicrobiota bacterium]